MKKKILHGESYIEAETPRVHEDSPSHQPQKKEEEEDECRKLRSLRGKRPRNYDSFIDRGANLGLADTDVRLINSVTVADDNKSEPSLL